LNRTLYAVVLFLVVSATLGAQQSAVARPDGRNITPAQIDSTVNRLIQAAHVTGAGVALFHDGKVAYLKTYGLRDFEKDLPLAPDSVMTAASLTKSAFATVVMRLVQPGVLNLDKPIEQYLGKAPRRLRPLRRPKRRPTHRQIHAAHPARSYYRLRQLPRPRGRSQAAHPLRSRDALRLLRRRHQPRATRRRNSDRKVSNTTDAGRTLTARSRCRALA
jgi:Beta-lactamase